MRPARPLVSPGPLSTLDITVRAYHGAYRSYAGKHSARHVPVEVTTHTRLGQLGHFLCALIRNESGTGRQKPSLGSRGRGHGQPDAAQLELAIQQTFHLWYSNTLSPLLALCWFKNKGAKAETPKGQVYSQDTVTKPCETKTVMYSVRTLTKSLLLRLGRV
jgi:hypothetical protein